MTETLTLPVTDTPLPDRAPTALRRRPGLLHRLALDTAYVVSAFVLCVVGFVVVVVGISAGLGLLVVWLGLGVLVGTVLAARGLAHVERNRLRTLQGKDAPAPSYAVAPDGAGAVRRLLTPLRDPQSWLDVLWGLVGFVTGTAAFVVVVSWWAGVSGASATGSGSSGCRTTTRTWSS